MRARPSISTSSNGICFFFLLPHSRSNESEYNRVISCMRNNNRANVNQKILFIYLCFFYLYPTNGNAACGWLELSCDLPSNAVMRYSICSTVYAVTVCARFYQKIVFFLNYCCCCSHLLPFAACQCAGYVVSTIRLSLTLFSALARIIFYFTNFFLSFFLWVSLVLASSTRCGVEKRANGTRSRRSE